MVLTIVGRKTREPYSRESCYWWEILATALKDMVVEGFIDEDKLNTFNTPFYAPSEAELGFLVEKEGSFNLNQVHISEVSWKPNQQHKNSHPFESDHDAFTKCIRAVTEYLVTSHFGESIVEEVYHRYKEFVKVSMGKENNVFISITVSLTRNG